MTGVLKMKPRTSFPDCRATKEKENSMNAKKTLGTLAIVAGLAIPMAVMAQDSMSQGSMDKKMDHHGMMKEDPMVGGAPMYANKDIVDNAVNSKDHTTLVAAVKAAGLVDTLKGKGPFTVFAPTNDAFNKLPAGTVDTLLKPENKKKLTQVLTYHVVAGNLDSAALAKKVKAGHGKATLKTVEGGKLTVSMDGSDVIITDAKGGTAKVTTADVYQSNGVIHVVDSVLLPG
jgi:uncharacterized surface protein with fasciclin (FAS1) repeats